jgi:riboflavin kinase/FMN adenylyltransferase
MELIRGLHNIRSRHRGCVATIGNFDGVHLGHRAVLKQLDAHARTRGLPSLVMVFEPQPREYFQGHDAPPRLTPLREKFELLADAKVDRLVCVRFDQRVASLPATQFVETLLVEALGVQTLVIGDDFRFGRSRGGDAALLRRLGDRYGFEVVRAVTYSCDDRRVSSTLLRQALAAGDLAAVERMLGRPYGIGGRVARFEETNLGRGVAVAIIASSRRSVPLTGIYAARLHGIGARVQECVAYIGRRHGDRTSPMLLARPFVFERGAVGGRVRVDFVDKIRDVPQQGSIEEVLELLETDAPQGRAVLAATSE